MPSHWVNFSFSAKLASGVMLPVMLLYDAAAAAAVAPELVQLTQCCVSQGMCLVYLGTQPQMQSKSFCRML
jgi:hypothetical protein